MSKFIPNSFQVPNALVDELMDKMSGNAFKCLVFIIRKTRGWHKESDRISLTQFQSRGMAKNTAIRALDELIALGLVERIESTHCRQSHAYKLTRLFDAAEVRGSEIEPVRQSSEVQKLNHTGSEIEPLRGSEIEHTKDTIKNTNKKQFMGAAEKKAWSPSLDEVNHRLRITTAKPITQDQLDAFVTDVSAWYAGKNLTDGQMFVHLIKWIVRSPVESTITPTAVYKTPEETKRLCTQTESAVSADVAKTNAQNLMRVLLGGAA